MEIAILIEDRDINKNIVDYVFKNFCYISQYKFELIGCFDIAEIDKIVADVYIIYGATREIITNKKIVQILYTPYNDQKEIYRMTEIILEKKKKSSLVPILDYTINEGETVEYYNSQQMSINFDLIWNAFFHMSLFREHLYEQKNKELGSYFYKLGVPEKVITIPIVNYLFCLLEECISTSYGNKLVYKEYTRRFEVLMTHDVDAIQKTLLIRAKQSVFFLYNAYKTLRSKDTRKTFEYLRRFLRMFFRLTNYKMLDKISEIDKRLNVKIVLFIYSKKKFSFKTLRYYIYNPQYDIGAKHIRSMFLNLKRKGINVGIHGSYESFCNSEFYKEEKDKIDKFLGKVYWNRNHWLKFNTVDTFEILEKNEIQFDSTLGFNDMIGFRSGLCTPFYPYNFKTEKAFNIIEFPMHIMDSALFNYLQLSDNDALVQMKEISERVKLFEGTLVLNWHNRVYSEDFNWHRVLHEFLEGGTKI